LPLFIILAFAPAHHFFARILPFLLDSGPLFAQFSKNGNKGRNKDKDKSCATAGGGTVRKEEMICIKMMRVRLK